MFPLTALAVVVTLVTRSETITTPEIMHRFLKESTQHRKHSNKLFSFIGWFQSHKSIMSAHETILMICEPIMLRCCVETSTSAYTQQGLPWLTFFRLGDKVLAPRHLGRTYPMWVAARFQIFVTSIRVLHRPLHWATWFLERWSDGFDWLGTRSNQTWHEWISSRRYICLSLSTLLQGSLLDHVFKKLPLTDSLSVNATIRRPARPGHHAECD